MVSDPNLSIALADVSRTWTFIFFFLHPNCYFNFLFSSSTFSILRSKVWVSFLPCEEVSSCLVYSIFFCFYFCYLFPFRLFLDSGMGYGWATTLTLFFSILPPTSFSSGLYLILTLKEHHYSIVVSTSLRASIGVSACPCRGVFVPSLIQLSQLLPCYYRASITINFIRPWFVM